MSMHQGKSTARGLCCVLRALQEGCCLERISKGTLTGNIISYHLDLGLLASRTL